MSKNTQNTKLLAKQHLKTKKDFKSWKIIIPTIVFIISLSISLFLLSVISKKALKIQKLRTENISLKMSATDKQLLQQELKQSKDDRAKLNDVFPDESNILNVIQLIDNIKDSSVTVVRFSLDSDVPTKIGRNPSFLPITLVLKGNNIDVNQALAKIINSRYLIKPVSFIKEYDVDTDQIRLQTQFYLYVDDNFNK